MWGIVESGAHDSTNAISLLVLSGLLAVADAGSAEIYPRCQCHGLIGRHYQFLLGMARLGVLVNFVPTPSSSALPAQPASDRHQTVETLFGLGSIARSG